MTDGIRQETPTAYEVRLDALHLSIRYHQRDGSETWKILETAEVMESWLWNHRQSAGGK